MHFLNEILQKLWLVRLPDYEVGYTLIKSANVSVVSRRRGEHRHTRLGLTQVDDE